MKNQLENQVKLVRGQLDILSLNILNLEAEVKQINSKINETDTFINHTAKSSNSEENSDLNNILLTERESSGNNKFFGNMHSEIQVQNVNPQDSLRQIKSSLAAAQSYDPRFYLQVIISEGKFPALVDSGASKSYAGPKIIPFLGKLFETQACMTVANQETVLVDGEKTVKFTFHGQLSEPTIRAVKSLGYDFVFGMDFLTLYGMMINFGDCSYRFGEGETWEFTSQFPSLYANRVDTLCSDDNVLSNNAIDTRYYIDLDIMGAPVRALIDTGSTRSYVGRKLEGVLAKAFYPVRASVIVANNSVEQVKGEANLLFTINGQKSNLPVRLVTALSYDCVLGLDFLKLFKIELNFGNHTWKSGDGPSTSFMFYDSAFNSEAIIGESAGLAEISDEQKRQVEELVNRLVEKPGKELNVTNLAELVIELEDPKPVRQNPRRYSPAVLAAAQKEVDKLLEKDIIEPAQSPWCSPPVLAPKTDGSGFRFPLIIAT